MKIYSVYDCVSDLYNGLILFPNDASAQRWFRTDLAKNPNFSDFVLSYVGEFDDLHGVISPDNKVIEKGVKVDEA